MKIIQGSLALLVWPSLAKAGPHGGFRGKAMKGSMGPHGNGASEKKQLKAHARAEAAKKKQVAQHARAGAAKKKHAGHFAGPAHRTKVKSSSELGEDNSGTWGNEGNDFFCDWRTEETCYDDDWNVVSCADYSEGCPCKEGEVKCGKGKYRPGYCTAVCCDMMAEETCYDEEWTATSCAPLAEGGCPCPEGEEKCGANKYWPGYCTDYCPSFGNHTYGEYYYGDYYYDYYYDYDSPNGTSDTLVNVEVE